jgi:flagellin
VTDESLAQQKNNTHGGIFMVIQHNMQAMNANRNLGVVTSQQGKSTEKLSSGYRINRAADDAAGLSISEKMRGQIRGLNQASTNAQDGISLIQTAEGALNETHAILQRMRQLAVQSSNDTYMSEDRTAIDAEIDQLVSEIDRIATTTQFNKMNLLDGSFTGKSLQIGANQGQLMSISIANTKAGAISVSAVDLSSQSGASAAISSFDKAIEKISEIRGSLGAIQNRLEHTIANLDTSAENLQAAESRIRDLDMAEEMVSYSKNNILQQAAQSMLAQANSSTQGVLSLLQ